MKKNFILISLFLIAAVALGQKKEINKAEKEVKSGNYAEAMNLLSQAEGMLSTADNEVKASFYLTRAEAYTNNLASTFKDYSKAGDDLNEAATISPSLKKTGRYEEAIIILKQKMEDSAVKDFNGQNYKSASAKYIEMYGLSKSDTIFLANAAISSKNAKEFDLAISYYETLIDIGYTNIKKEYTAINKESGKTEAFPTKEERNQSIDAGTYISPGERNTISKQDDFLNDLTILYAETGNNEKAVELIHQLRLKEPNNDRLLRAEADLNFKMGNLDKYNELISELISKDPNNPELFFNMGVTANKSGNEEKAMEYYQKAIEIDPNYVGAQINLASMILDSQTPLVEEMNALGTSSADYKRYDILKEQLTQIQKSAIPYLEAAVRLRPDDIDFARTLMNIYSQVGDDAKASALEQKIEQMGG